MTRRITCYVVFVTLIWGAHTEDEEKVRDIFKSNMTRSEFSHLLQSLINLNEQRVGVLQKLYRLEDYGVLSEVLRSGDKKSRNGKPNNLFLIVMSKNQNDPSRRKIGFQLVDSATSLNAGSNNNPLKLDFVLDPSDYFSQNIGKEGRLETIFGNFPRVGPTKIHQADDGSKQISTTKETLKLIIPDLRTKLKHASNASRATKTSLKANEDRKYHKVNSRYEIVSNKVRRPNASEELLDYNGNSNKHPQTVEYNSQSNEYLETDFTIKNDKLTTKLIIIKDILSSNHKNSKYSLKGKDEKDDDFYGSPFSNIENDHNRQYTKIISDISIKKHNGNNHETNKYTTKVKVQSNQQNNKLTTKPITIKDILSSYHHTTKYSLEVKDEQDEDYYGSPFSNIENDHNSQYTIINSDISIKKLHVKNHNNSKTDKNTPMVNVQRNQHPELNQNKSNLNNQGNKNFKIKAAVKTTILKNYYSINSTVNSDRASENNHSIKNSNLYNDNINVNNHDLIHTKIKHIDATKEIGNDTKFPLPANVNVYSSKPVIPETTKDTQYGSYLDFEDYKDVRDNSNVDKPETVKDTPFGNYPASEYPKDVRDNSNKDKPKTAKDTRYGNYPGFENLEYVRDNSNKDKLKTANDTPFGNFHVFEYHKNVMENLNKDKLNTAKDLRNRDYHNIESKKNTDNDGVKMFDNGKRSGEEFSIFITNVGNGTAEEMKQRNDPKFTQNAFDQPESKPIARNPFVKCLNKKALKLCSKSCISAYKNVCQKLKCTSRSKKALKSECKRSCKKTFASSSSKYSNEGSDEGSDDESSDVSYSDDDHS